MSNKTSIVERAFQLAQDGTCRTTEDIRRKLTAEGFDSVNSHLASRSLAKQLRSMMQARQEDSREQ